MSGGASSSVIANVTAVTLRCSNRPQYVYVVNNGDNAVSQDSVDASEKLAPLSVATIATSVSPQAGTVHRSREYVYVPHLADDTVSQYVIKGDGSLALNTPAIVATGLGPWALEAN